MSGTHRVALVGFGTVGKGFCEIVKQKTPLLKKQFAGMNIEVVAVADKMKGSVYAPGGLDIEALLKWDAEGKKLSDFKSAGEVHSGWDVLKVCAEAEADSILEVAWTNLDDGQPGISHMEAALGAGKNVITTNKGPAVFAFSRLQNLAESKGAKFMIEGTVMAGTPVLSLLRTMPAAEVYEIQGLLNGTCNYILTQMENEGMEFSAALKQAQELGYAEADPFLDVSGGDARAKAIILTHVLGLPLDINNVPCTGIEGITLDMIEKAKSEGKRWKLISQVKLTEDKKGVEKVCVEPMCLDLSHPLSGVGGALNALNFKTDMLGPDLTIVGPGAGKIETGFSLFADLMHIANKSQ